MLSYEEDVYPAARDAHLRRTCHALAYYVRSACQEIVAALQRREGTEEDAQRLIAQRDRLAEALNEYETYSRWAVDDAPGVRYGAHMVCRLDADGLSPLRVDERIAQLIGYDPECVQEDVWRILHPQEQAQARAAFAALGASMLAGETTHAAFPVKLRHRAGFPVWARVSATYLQQVESHPHVVVLTLKNETEAYWASVVVDTLHEARRLLCRGSAERGLLREIDRFLRGRTAVPRPTPARMAVTAHRRRAWCG